MILIIDNGQTWSDHRLYFVEVDDGRASAIVAALEKQFSGPTGPFIMGEASVSWRHDCGSMPLATFIEGELIHLCGVGGNDGHDDECKAESFDPATTCTCWVNELRAAAGLEPWKAW